MKQTRTNQKVVTEEIDPSDFLHEGDITVLSSEGDIIADNYSKEAAISLISKGSAYIVSSEAVAFFGAKGGDK